MNILTDKQLCDIISLVTDLMSNENIPSEYYISEWFKRNEIKASNNVKEHIIDVLLVIKRNEENN